MAVQPNLHGMSYILTTIYPAPDGDAAANYAAELALVMKLPLRIVMPYVVPIAIGEIPMPIMAVEEVREAANIRLAEATKGLATKYPSITITTDVVYGNITDVLDDVADGKPMPILTVIGNSDSDGADSWMSNESSDIMREGSH